jgi:hypothetical protein
MKQPFAPLEPARPRKEDQVTAIFYKDAKRLVPDLTKRQLLTMKQFAMVHVENLRVAALDQPPARRLRAVGDE